MPIRFRCAYCNQLMGIARRKAGTVVSCPTCHGQVVVPSPEAPAQQPVQVPAPAPQPASRAGAAGNVFEQKDFDPALFNPSPAPAPPAPVQHLTMPQEPAAFQPAFDPGTFAPAANLTPPRARGFVLTTGQVVMGVVGGVVLLLLAFAAGFAAAKWM
jgi:hypothetical protein